MAAEAFLLVAVVTRRSREWPPSWTDPSGGWAQCSGKGSVLAASVHRRLGKMSGLHKVHGKCLL